MVLKVGAATEVEMKERKHRIEDAISATRAAIEEGIVAGGGTALVHAAAVIDGLDLTGDEATGAQIVKRSVDAPLHWIAENAGEQGNVVVAQVRATGQGFNAATGEYGDLIAQGVIDPVKVTRSALQNASSIAGLLLTTEVLVVEKPEEDEDDGGPRPQPRSGRSQPLVLAGAVRPLICRTTKAAPRWGAAFVVRRERDGPGGGPVRGAVPGWSRPQGESSVDQRGDGGNRQSEPAGGR